MWRPNKQNWHEPAAYCTVVLVTVFGVCASLRYEPAWLGRAGSLVIVIGVLLAASRKVETLHERVLKFVDGHRKNNPHLVRDEFRKLKMAEPTDTEVRALEDVIYQSAKDDIAVLINERRWIFKLHEVAIVIAGTLLNGFGEWIMKRFA